MKALEVKNLKKNYKELTVLKGIDFSLDKGEVLAIIGSSGGGKTTLLKCLNFLELADHGQILVNDEVIYDADKKYTDEELRNNRLRFGLVFQQFNLFPQYTVLENVTLAPNILNKDTKENNISKAKELLNKVGLSKKENAYPYMLSGGESQRVAIARALAMNPDILCFDEPTSALDPELTKEVLKTIKELKNSNNTMIVVTHELDFAKNVADKIIFISDGIIEEIGTSDEVFNNPKSNKTKDFLNSSLMEI